jgi:hypothetical protein
MPTVERYNCIITDKGLLTKSPTDTSIRDSEGNATIDFQKVTHGHLTISSQVQRYRNTTKQTSNGSKEGRRNVTP